MYTLISVGLYDIWMMGITIEWRKFWWDHGMIDVITLNLMRVYMQIRSRSKMTLLGNLLPTLSFFFQKQNPSRSLALVQCCNLQRYQWKKISKLVQGHWDRNITGVSNKYCLNYQHLIQRWNIFCQIKNYYHCIVSNTDHDHPLNITKWDHLEPDLERCIIFMIMHGEQWKRMF